MKLEVIKDIIGQPYVAIVFSSSRENNGFILSYLDKLKQYLIKDKSYLKEEYDLLLSNKYNRDGYGHWHITVFNSMECKKFPYLLLYDGVEINTPNVICGIGTISKKMTEKSEFMETYFIILENKELDDLARIHELEKRNYHITLGFHPKDLFHAPKDYTSLIEGLEYQEPTVH